jgi:hypothetical protein
MSLEADVSVQNETHVAMGALLLALLAEFRQRL